VDWLNNPDVNRYLECRHYVHTLTSVTEYVTNLSLPSSVEILFGIFVNHTSRHIGNIKLGPIDGINHHASMGLVIGDIKSWGKGYGSRAIRLLTDAAVTHLDMKTLVAGCYSSNRGSFKAFLKAGWKHVGTIPSYWTDHLGERNDEILMAFSPVPKLAIPPDGGVTLIGSGRLLETTAINLRQRGIDVLVVMASRHYSKFIEDRLVEQQIHFFSCDNPNSDDFLEATRAYTRLCLCFGPAWIFSSQILKHFGDRIFNYNGIPLPSYLGGAHFTWQILNDSFEGGAYIQQITMDIDRGPFYAAHTYSLPSSNKYLPSHYEEANHDAGFALICEFLDRCVQVQTLQPIHSGLPDWSRLSYFPRLLSSRHAWIDWSWEGYEIERFCRAFGHPYSGATTLLSGDTVSLQGVSFESDHSIHPFCAGIVGRVNLQTSEAMIYARGGRLHVSTIKDVKTGYILQPRLGSRLVTPREKLDESFMPVRYDSFGPA
jgi:RimJ/RimL family protein N-acetyltransferase/methionyl-tRNA formyltransferase